MRRFYKMSDGEISRPARQRKDGTFLHRLKCCDCGLEHVMQYSISSRGLRFRAWRLNHKRKPRVKPA